MDLLATARALDDPILRWRIMAAQIEHAQNFQQMSGNPRNYALTVMLNPQTVDPSMIAMVCSDDIIAGSIEVDPVGAVNTTKVTDDDILRVVIDKWGLVSHKYPNDPLSPARGSQQ